MPASIEQHALESVRRADRRRGTGEHARRRPTSRASAARRSRARTAPRSSASSRHEVPWVGCQYPTPALAQEAGMSTRRVRRLPLRRRACSTGTPSASGCSATPTASTPPRRCGSSATRPTSGSRSRGRSDAGRRRRRQHPGRRVLRLPGRGLRRGRDRVHRVPGRLQRARDQRASGSASRAGGSSTPPRRRTRTSCVETLDSDDGARRLGELGIGCNPGHHALHAEHAVRREDRRHRPPRARQRHARPRRDERVRASTGTSSRTSACRGRGSSSTARSSSRTARG